MFVNLSECREGTIHLNAVSDVCKKSQCDLLCVKSACNFKVASKWANAGTHLTGESLPHKQIQYTCTHRTYLPWVQRHFTNAWFCDFPGCFDSSCSNRDFHLHTSEHTKIPSHPLTFTDEDTQIRINTHQCVGPHTHTAYEYTHIHTLINSYIPCIQNILEIGSYKHTDRFSEDLYHIPQCVQVKLEYC